MPLDLEAGGELVVSAVQSAVLKPGYDGESAAAEYAAAEFSKAAAAVMSGVHGEPLQASRMSVEFRGINSFVPNLNLGGGDKDAPKKRQILFNVSGGVAPGEVLALMGPSGSGKTSLLSVLGGRVQKGIEVQGSITFNGQKADRSLKRKLGFVTQDDLLFDALTVYETLWYAAQLRLPAEMTPEERAERVDSVITTLGLDRCRDTIIGGPMRRGVSGGERKRVSVGHELIINPAVLFLDEPTSGLDSTTALSLVGTLRELASSGRTILTTIHQPSSRMYQQLDKLMLLSQGHTLYYGDSQEAGAWFASLGSPCPFGVNLADHILDMASGNNHSSDQDATRLKQVESYRQLQSAAEFDIMAGVHSVEDAGKERSQRASTSSDSSEAQEEQEEPRWAASWLKQVGVLTVRNFKVNRFERVNTQTILQHVLVAVTVGLLWWQRGSSNSVESVRDTTGLLFFEMLFPMFSALFSALFVFPSQMQFLRKERASGMYRLSAYYVAKVISDLALDLLLPTTGVVILYFMSGLRLNPVWAFFANWLTIILMTLAAQGFGLVLGAGFANPKSAQTIATVVMLGFMLLGGFYISDIPVWVSWVKYLSWIYYGYNMLLHIEYQGREIVDCSVDPCQVVDLQDTFGLQKDPNDSVALDAGMLVVMFVVLRVMVYFVLNVKTKAS